MVIDVKEEKSLGELMLAEFKTASKSTVKKLITHGSVRVNGKMVTNPTVVLKMGDSVEYTRQTYIPTKIKPPYPVYFEDDHIMITEKPPGLLTIGDRGLGGTSFYKIMLDHVKEASKGKERIYVIHRLDREVSGLILFAKTEPIQEQFKNQWHASKKLYYALVEGVVKDDNGTIRTWLAEGRDQKVYSVKVQEGAKLAITVVGDRRYGADDSYERRIRLHAFYLSFNHPVTGKLIEAKSKMPKGFLVLRPENEKYK
jgi:23S rRNA pseudouridine1911/1915/1917 synthase